MAKRLTPEQAAKVAADIRRPADGAPAGCTTERGAFRITWLHDGARRPEVTGPSFDNPRDAAMVATALNASRR